MLFSLSKIKVNLTKINGYDIYWLKSKTKADRTLFSVFRIEKGITTGATYQKQWAVCVCQWSPMDSGPCSDTWSHWVLQGLAPKPVPSHLSQHCRPAVCRPPVSRWTEAQETPHSGSSMCLVHKNVYIKEKRWRERKKSVEAQDTEHNAQLALNRPNVWELLNILDIVLHMFVPPIIS